MTRPFAAAPLPATNLKTVAGHATRNARATAT